MHYLSIPTEDFNHRTYTQLLRHATNSTRKRYLCNHTQTGRYAVATARHKEDLPSQHTSLTLRDIAIQLHSFQTDLSSDATLAGSAKAALQIMIDRKKAKQAQKNILQRIFESAMDCFHNLFTGYGFITSISLAERICQELETSCLAQRIARPGSAQPGTGNPTTRIPTLPTRPPADPSHVPSLFPAGMTVNTTPSGERMHGLPTSRPVSVRERVANTNDKIRVEETPKPAPQLTGTPENPNPKRQAQKNYKDGKATTQDLFVIFQDIGGIELFGTTTGSSLEGLMLELSETSAVKLEHPVCHKIVIDAFKHLNKTGCDALANWLKTQKCPIQLYIDSLQALGSRKRMGQPEVPFAAKEVLSLYMQEVKPMHVDPMVKEALSSTLHRNHPNAEHFFHFFGYSARESYKCNRSQATGINTRVSPHDLYIIFQNIDALEHSASKLDWQSLVGLNDLINSTSFDLSLDTTKRLIIDGCGYMNKNACDELASWLTTQSPPIALIIDCLQAFLERDPTKTTISCQAILKMLLLYTALTISKADPIAKRALQLVVSLDPNISIPTELIYLQE